MVAFYIAFRWLSLSTPLIRLFLLFPYTTLFRSSVLLAGILLKMGTYGFLRFAVPFFPGVAQSPAVTSLVERGRPEDRKSTRLNSSHVAISYAVFCLKKKTYYLEADTAVRC